MYQLIIILKAINEIALLSLLAQGVMFLFAGAKRDSNALGVDLGAEPLPADPLEAVWFAAARGITGPLDAHRVLAADDLDVRFATLLDALAGTEIMLRHRLDEDR